MASGSVEQTSGSAPPAATSGAVPVPTANVGSVENEIEGRIEDAAKKMSKMDLNMKNCPKIEKLKSEKDYMRWSKQVKLACVYMGIEDYVRLSKSGFHTGEYDARAAIFTTLLLQQSMGEHYQNMVMDIVIG